MEQLLYMSNKTSTINRPVPDRKPRPMIDLLVSIIIPSAILMKLSGADDLGASGALIAALAFPLGWGLYYNIRQYWQFLAIFFYFCRFLSWLFPILALTLALTYWQQPGSFFIMKAA